MPRPRLVPKSIRTPWVRSAGGVLAVVLILFVGRDLPGTPIGGLPRAPVRAMPCPPALLAKTARLTMSNHSVLTPIYYGKFPVPPAIAAATYKFTFTYAVFI